MQVFRSTAIVAPFQSRPVSARTLRLWCAPEVILGITDLTDEAVLLPQLISQARQSSAKIVLAHVHDAQAFESGRKLQSITVGRSLRTARETLERMARQLRWLGVICEPIVLSGHTASEIPLLARSCGVDRVLTAFAENPDLTDNHVPLPWKDVLGKVGVPVCVLGRNAIHNTRTIVRNVTLAISSRSRCEVPLGFACRLAQEQRARLTVLHVSERASEDATPCKREAVLAKLPFPPWREAELFCPTEIAIRVGTPADEILHYCADTQQDLLILCSPGGASSPGAWRNGVSHRAINAAQCPVFIVGTTSETPASMAAVEPSASQKLSPQREESKQKERKEALM